MEGANPCQKSAVDLREPLEPLQKLIPWHQKIKTLAQKIAKMRLFLGTCTHGPHCVFAYPCYISLGNLCCQGKY